MAQTIETPTEVETKLFTETLELIKNPREPKSNKGLFSFLKKTPENTLSINLLKIGINHQESDLDVQEKKEEIRKKLEKLKSDNDKRVEKSKKAEEEPKKIQQFEDLSSAKIKYNQKIIELLELNPKTPDLSSEYLSKKQIDILREVSSYKTSGEFNQDHYFFGLAFANYAMENIDNPNELKKIQDFLKKFQKTMDIESEISELRKGDDDKEEILQLKKLPKIQIQSVKTLYEVFKYNNGAHQFLHHSKDALYTTETEQEEATFQLKFKNLQEKLNPKYKNQISPSSSEFIIKTTSDTEIQGNNLEELYGNFDKKLSGGFTEFSTEIDKGLLKTEYKNFFKRKILDFENIQDYGEISKFLSFYKKFHSLCRKQFTAKIQSENEMTGSELKAFDAIDKEVGIDDFRKKIVDKFMKILSSAEDKETKIKEFNDNITDEDTIKKFKEQLKKKLFEDLEKLSIDEATSDFFIERKPEIDYVGIVDFREKVRKKIYENNAEKKDQTKLFTAYKESKIDLGSQKIFRGFVENDKDKENLRRQLRDELTRAKDGQQKFEDFLDDNRHLFFLKTLNPFASTILSCVDRFGNLLGSLKPNNQVAPDNCDAVQKANGCVNVRD